jgi:mono/diheme cytochrome c family protein
MIPPYFERIKKMAFSKPRLVWLGLFCLLVGSSAMALQVRAQNVKDGAYTEDQAKRGQAMYSKRCSSCHGNDLGGRTGPPLAGDVFLANWSTQPLLELANKIGRTMPKDDTPRLTAQETADVLAFMLQAGKFPAGQKELPVDEAALKQINLPAVAQPKAPAVAAQTSMLPAAGNVAQVMRGILFPSANIIFTTQSIDPGAPKPPTDSGGTGGFDWFTWGNGVYRGWDVVDYAAISVAESATLMLTPGRKCENGQVVPVSDPDWIKFTMELADAGKAAYKASQTRKQDTISESTNQLNDSCMHCHNVYRGRTHCVKAANTGGRQGR